MIPSWRLIGGRGFAELVTLAAAAISLIVVARSVGPSVLGDYALATSISQAGFILIGLGTAASAARHVATDRDGSDTWWTVVTIRTVPAVVLALGVAAVATQVGGQWPDFGFAIAASLGAYVLRSEWLLIGSGAVMPAAWSRVVSTVAMALTALVIVNAPEPAVLVPWLIVVPNLVYPLMSVALAAANSLLHAPPPADRLRIDAVALLRSSPGFVVGDLSTYVYSGLDRVLLYVIASPAAAGLYDAAFKLIQPFYVIGTVATDTMFRPLAALPTTPSRATIGRYADLMLIATVPLGAFLTCFSASIIGLVYGPGFADAGTTLAVLGWVITVGYLAGLLVLPTMAWGRPTAYATATSAGAVASVLGNVLLVPPLAGVGTAIAGVVAKLVTGVVAYPAFRRVAGTSLVSLSTTYVVASIVAGVVGAAGQVVVSSWFGVGAFILAYGLVVWLLRRHGSAASVIGPRIDVELDQTAVDSNTRVTG